MLEIIENEKESNRKKPPKHIADFDLKERKKFAEELGLPGFRADQVSRHWFGEEQTLAASLRPATIPRRRASKRIFGAVAKYL